MKLTGSFARSRSVVAAGLLSLIVFGVSYDADAAKSARALYNEAVRAEDQLNKSKKLRSDKNSWLKVARQYRLVVLNHPRSGYCDDALWHEGEIYKEVDKRFGSRDAARRSLDAYILLVDGYPSSKWNRKARLRKADLYLNRYSDSKAAKKELNDVISRWPKSDEAGEARRVLARLNPPTKKKVPSGLVAVRNVRHWTGREYTRIVIDMDEEVKYQQVRLTNPDRIYFDLHESRISQSLPSRIFPIDDGFLKRIRVAQNKNDVVRVVLDFESISRFNVFSLHDPYRLVVDILGIKPNQPTSVVAAKKAPTSTPESAGEAPAARSSSTQTPNDTSVAEPPRAETPPNSVAGTPKPAADSAETDPDILPPLPPDPTPDGRFPLARQLGLSARRVVIDPGHGGHDPGTMSSKGVKEKDLVLDISRRVAKMLENDDEFDVLMTRNKDVFIPLEERTAIANSQGADLFVSIHVNAHPRKSVRGIETFYLNLATTPDAEETAARENAVSTRRMSELQDILRQIMNNSKIAESGDFAQQVQASMVQGVLSKNDKKRNHGVKTAPFYVLLGANMPCVLVEVSYLSNSADAELLSTTDYRQRLALSIANGIRQYTSSLKKVARRPSRQVLGGTKQPD